MDSLKKSKNNMNTPYVKKYKNGKLENPITSVYTSEYPNRRQRRQRPSRFRGNHAGVSLTVTETSAYKRIVQVIKMIQKVKNKLVEQTVENNHVKIRTIRHYVSK